MTDINGGSRRGFCIPGTKYRHRYRARLLSRTRDREKENKTEWLPSTELGILICHGIISSLEQIRVLSLPIHESEIFDFFLGTALKVEVLKILAVQKQTQVGQHTGFKAIVAIGDANGHIGLGVKCFHELASAIQEATASAKLSIVPIRRGFWGSKLGNPHTITCKVQGSSGSASICLMPAPRGTGIVSLPIIKKILQMAGIQDCYSSFRRSKGSTGDLVKATYAAIVNTFAHLSTHEHVQDGPRESKAQELSNEPR